ncbi:SPOR domain-containing protein [Sphingomonas profundi]|uniref:SPOR domain-containing protein n=1 Tax=Alterirhizorhabdus profundi TaxID=2681549 RepID=UPI0012E8F72C|nr:SPOR domain-containing protein [Sphingomonas profundi]
MTSRYGIFAVTGLLAALLAPAVAAPAQRRPDAPAKGADGDAVTAGADAWDGGNYARALAIWRPLAVAGNRNAQYNLAQAYRLGRGVTRDEKVAQDWYYKAALQNHTEALANYGLLLFQNGNRKGALPWLQKAADRGDPRAQYVIGTALFNGDLAPKDWVRAYALMTRAASAGLPPAVKSLSEMDLYVPLAQRTQGTALARDLERSAALANAAEDDAGQLVRANPPRPAPAAVTPPAVAQATPAPAPKRQSYAAATPPPAPAPAPKAAPKPAPAPKPAAAPTPAPKPIAAGGGGGGWRVQVGAYSDPAAAGKAWDGIVRKVPGLGLRSYLVKAGAITRLQAGPIASRADAGKACAKIAATGAACFPVAAP